jgi:Txe/YoeB family toxin of Txe-Axe toxin-antitoxin module
MPQIAADEDLIEKEWVEKAKQVISETKHDPYSQEQAVRKLQAEYLSKRYGKVINVPKEE